MRYLSSTTIHHSIIPTSKTLKMNNSDNSDPLSSPPEYILDSVKYEIPEVEYENPFIEDVDIYTNFPGQLSPESKFISPDLHPPNENENTECRIYNCSCRKKFTLLKNFETHLKICHQKPTSKENLLKRKKNIRSYHQHWRKLSHFQQMNKRKCPVCSTTFPTVYKFELHFRTVHPTEHPHLCKICSKGFNLRHQLARHMKRHVEERIYSCDQCDKVYTVSEDLRLHQIDAHSPHPTVPCPKCPIRMTSVGAIAIHLQYVHNIRSTYFPCARCPATFKTSLSLLQHDFIHTRTEPGTCDICWESHPSVKALITHVRSKHFSSPKHKCQFCDKEFHLKKWLDDHKTTDHPPLKCSLCDTTCESEGLLYHHMTHSHRQHMKEEVDEEVPSRSGNEDAIIFVRPASPAPRNNSSSGYKCPLCKRSFKVLDSMRKHQDNCHPRGKQAKSTGAEGLGSSSKGAVDVKHLCNVCGAEFEAGTALRHHVRTEHPRTSNSK